MLSGLSRGCDLSSRPRVPDSSASLHWHGVAKPHAAKSSAMLSPRVEHRSTLSGRKMKACIHQQVTEDASATAEQGQSVPASARECSRQSLCKCGHGSINVWTVVNHLFGVFVSLHTHHPPWSRQSIVDDAVINKQTAKGKQQQATAFMLVIDLLFRDWDQSGNQNFWQVRSWAETRMENSYVNTP